MKTNKYYIIKRNDSKLLQSYLWEFDLLQINKIEKQINVNDPLLLIEKTYKDHSESFTNLWTIQEGSEKLWEKYVNGKVMYDYTGIVHPIIHYKGKQYFFDEYTSKKFDKL